MVLRSSQVVQPSNRCICTRFMNISEVLEIGIFRRCNAVDDRYGVLYNCFRYANNVYPPKTSQKMVYCWVHTNMFIQHRLCFYCNLFCSQGDFVICDANVLERHYMHQQCITKYGNRCCHCGEKKFFGHTSLFTYDSIYILVKLSDILFSYNSGKQLNLVSLLCDSSKLLLLNELDRLKSSVVETHICASNNLCFHINSHNFEVPFRWIWHHSILGKEHLENIFILRALKDAIIHNNVNVVLLILQFIDVKIDYDSLEKAIIHVDSILTKILLHHEAPLFSNEDGQMNDILLESVKKKSSAILEELLKFRRLNCYYTSKNVTSDAMLLLLAIKSSWLRGVILLLEYGVNVLAVNERGETALHILASTLSKDVFVVGQAVLRTRQFSPSFINVADHNGLVPLAIAYKKSNWIIARLFLEYGARPIELSNDMKVPSSFRSFLDRISKKFASLRILSVPRHYISHDIAKGNEKVPIPVIGNILGDSFPLDFEYTPYVLNIDMFKSRIDFSLACSCLNFCQSGCPCISRSIYNANGRLSDEVIALADTSNLGVIIECNSSCFCSSSCKSKIAQRGIRHRLEIFRSSKYGWAVRSAVPISKGDFICEYTGELISNEEADRREVDTYLFEIVENSIIYCIDARNKGNVARFVNHSCDANLLVLKVVWDANVRHFPHICFFAKRDIQKGEELTIDYGRQWWDVKRKYFSCLCGSSACRYRETLSDQESNQNLIFPY